MSTSALNATKTNEWSFDRFSQAMDAGWEAWWDDVALDSCPFGPALRIPEDGANDEHQGWLMGWWEAEMAERERKAFNLGFDAAVDVMPWDVHWPCPFKRRSREEDAWIKGWTTAMVLELHDYPDLH